MDSSVSAFAIYKAKNKANNTKKQQKKQRSLVKNVSETKKLSEQTIKTATKKLKQAKPKDNLKKKLHKKKKKGKQLHGSPLQDERSKKKFVAVQNTSRAQEEVADNDTASEEVPLLVPATSSSSNSRLPNNTEMAVDRTDAASVGSAGSFEVTPVATNSVSEGLRVFIWMIAPFNAREFFVNIWEKKPIHISRSKPNYYKDILSTPWIDKMLRTENIQFTKNIDITSYIDEKRETHNPVGRAHPHVVWDYYLNGCSIRLLNPQTYTPKLHLLNATLQEFFNCFVGANAYLTPPDSQGFAPHYDDIEAFILQIEGKKHWKVYAPRNEKETLPRVSSKNFEQDEIGEPILEVTLEAGDMLYFPRGFIHQGVTIDGEHSLHVTVSMYQKHSWADLFEILIPNALQTTIDETSDMRRGIPFDLYDNFGLVNTDLSTPRKTELTNLIKVFCDRIKYHIDIEKAVDELAKVYQHDALPPVLTDSEKALTVYGDFDVMVENGKVIDRVEINLDTRIRLLRRNILRMVMEEETIRIYYCVENSLEYRGNDLQFLEIEESLAPAVETLILSYPEYVFVENLDVPTEAEKLQVASDLWERGLIMTEHPLIVVEDD